MAEGRGVRVATAVGWISTGVAVAGIAVGSASLVGSDSLVGSAGGGYPSALVGVTAGAAGEAAAEFCSVGIGPPGVIVGVNQERGNRVGLGVGER